MMFPFNNIVDESDYLCSVYNYVSSSKINMEIIKNAQQLELVNNLNICDNDIDLDTFFTVTIIILVMLTI